MALAKLSRAPNAIDLHAGGITGSLSRRRFFRTRPVPEASSAYGRENPEKGRTHREFRPQGRGIVWNSLCGVRDEGVARQSVRLVQPFLVRPNARALSTACVVLLPPGRMMGAFTPGKIVVAAKNSEIHN